MPFLAYFAVLAIAVGSVLFGLDLLTSPLPPSYKPTIHAVGNAPPNPIRQIPIGRATVTNDVPNGGPTPVHPANPGGALKERQAEKLAAAPPPPETKTAVANTQPQAEQQKAEPPKAAEAAVTPQTAPPNAEPSKADELTAAKPVVTQQPVAPQAPQAAPPVTPQPPQQAAQAASAPMPSARPNSCNLQACAVAYKSFRAEDCSYQPFDGPRRVCENPPAQQHEQVALRPRERGPLTVTRDRRVDELDDVAREVRQLSRRDTIDDEDHVISRRRGVVILDEPYDDVMRPPRSIGR